jgi:CRISPR-associated protein Cmr4
MYKSTQPLFLFCETPLHAGSGNDLGIIDLPIQRERHTGFPKIESSGLKGSLREAFEKTTGINQVEIHKVFGYDDDAADTAVKASFINKKDREFAGALAVTDARILLFPVKSQKGVFAWITCNRVLSRFEDEMINLAKAPDFPTIGILSEGSVGTISNILDGTTVRLEEYSFSNCGTKAADNAKVSAIGKWLADKLYTSGTYWHTKMQKDIVVLSDEDFTDFVNHSTEVITRTKIDNETGTVSDTALFTEEFLPSETLMYSLVMFAPEFKKGGLTDTAVKAFFVKNQPEVLQIGGNASLGKGIVRTKLKTPQQNGGN